MIFGKYLSAICICGTMANNAVPEYFTIITYKTDLLFMSLGGNLITAIVGTKISSGSGMETRRPVNLQWQEFETLSLYMRSTNSHLSILW